VPEYLEPISDDGGSGRVIENFTESDRPPNKPTDPFFKYEPTTLHVSDVLPSMLGNTLLDILCHDMVSSISKVKREKFLIKVDTFIKSVMCTMKIRIYFEEHTTHAIEFQRRCGDCMAFRSAYHQAALHLKRHFPGIVNAPLDDEVSIPPSLAGNVEQDPVGETAISPYLDLAGYVEQPNLQAESATALVDVAENDGTVTSLCTLRAFAEFKKLLRAKQLEVAYPTAQMLLLIARRPEAVPCFTDPELLRNILEKVRSAATGALVREPLAETLGSALVRCATRLPPEVCEDIASSLTEAIEHFGSQSVRVHQGLQDALNALGARSASAPCAADIAAVQRGTVSPAGAISNTVQGSMPTDSASAWGVS